MPGVLEVTELKQWIDRGDLPAMVDVREPWEYELCRIDGSINIPMSEIGRRMQELDPEQDTVMICHHGSRSYQVACFLEDAGFNKVNNLEGGIDAWADIVDQQMPRY